MEFKKQSMVRWYSVKQLMSTALKTVVSGVFGSYSDKREIQAFTEQKIFDELSEKEELWFDYISDLGDGFNSTYTMAHLMAMEEIQVNGELLPRSQMLIMGGDEVYPTPERKEYRNRLQGPYNAAFPWIEEKDEPKELKPKLFAIPGNHDWYDGLTNFIRLFCQGRSLGNWLTSQKRSYFAIQLPHRYWLLGIDIQLKGDIDDPQLAYFKQVADKKFRSGDKIILCTAEPTWVYASLSEDMDAEKRLNFFIEKILYECKLREDDVHVEVILTGDLHHYSRYETQDKKGKTTQLITAGGGGAFMHPTHFLKEKIQREDKSKASLKSVFPSFKQSRNLCWRNMAFPYYNWSMCLFLGMFHLITSWFIQSATIDADVGSFMETMSGIELAFDNICHYLCIILATIKHSPAVFLLNAILFFGILMFTDTATGKKNWNYSIGLVHAIAQLANLYFCIWLFSVWNINLLELDVDYFWQVFLFIVEMLVLGGFFSGLIFGIYLLISTLVFKSHPTEASSSFRHEGYKNFLRIHVSKDKLTIYPIGLKKIVRNWKSTGDAKKPKFTGGPISYSLIEDKPIVIHHKP